MNEHVTREEFELLSTVVEILLAHVNPNDLDNATPEAKDALTCWAAIRLGGGGDA